MADGHDHHQRCAVSDSDICRGTCHGRGRVCIRIGRRRHLAAHPHADADRDIDHRLRSRGAGHLGLEIAARAAMESALAVPARRGVWSKWARPDYVRVTVGVVLVLYSAYSLARPVM